MNQTPILIITAVRQELNGLIGALERPLASLAGGREILSGQIAGKAVSLLVTGPGMANTAQALTAFIEQRRPKLILQTGCAGAFRPSGLKIGDIAVATRETDAGLGIEAGNEEHLIEDLPFAVITSNSGEIGNTYPVHSGLSDVAHAILSAVYADTNIRVMLGAFVTVATITASERRAKRLHSRFAACMEAMEGAAAAHVALHYGIPFVEIRAASNYVGKRDKSAWNLELAFERCAAASLAFVRGLDTTLLNSVAEGLIS